MLPTKRKGGTERERAKSLWYLAGGHGDLGRVLSVWDAQMVTVNVHQLELELGDLVLLCGKGEGDEQK